MIQPGHHPHESMWVVVGWVNWRVANFICALLQKNTVLCGGLLVTKAIYLGIRAIRVVKILLFILFSILTLSSNYLFFLITILVCLDF